MSRDIRSFFTVLSKKTGEAPNTQKPKRPTALIDSDDDDIIVKSTPEKAKKAKRRPVVLSSDSEEEKPSKDKSLMKKQKTSAEKHKKEEKPEEKPKLKPIDLDALNKPIKQSEVKLVKHVLKEETGSKAHENEKKEKPKKKSKRTKNPEIGVHDDKDFEKTLEDLDADTDDTILLDNLDILEKTIEEATHSEPTSGSKKEDSTKSREKGQKTVDPDQAKPHKEIQREEVEHGTPKKTAKRLRKNSETTPTPKKKKKLEQTDSGIDNEFEKWDKKRNSAGLYVAYLHRGGPKHHGEKEYPKGKPDCLSGLTFLRTGVLDSLEGDEFENLVTSHGGRIVHSVSKKINYIVVGDEPGPAKLEKATKYHLPQISEDEFLDLILVKSGMKPKYAVKCQSEDLGLGGSEEGSPKSLEKYSEEMVQDDDIELKTEDLGNYSDNKNANAPEVKEIVHSESSVPTNKHSEKSENIQKVKMESKEDKPSIPTDSKQHLEVKKQSISTQNVNYMKSAEASGESLSWTDKYKPTNTKAIIGQQDANSNMNKLKRWLENWFKNANPEVRKKLPRPTLYNQFDGAFFKAALLSGPPGVGKTTTATLVAKELGFDIVEFNASDTRSKKLLHEEISHMMRSKTVAGFASGQQNINQKRVLLMDEVDGMAGNEDRGGISELINFIKTANFPIICMCNNRDLPKMRTLVNHCYALKYGKPNVAQIRGAMLSICFKEGLKIKPDSLAQLINGTGCDIRQTLNHLSMWSATEKTLTSETVQKESKNSQKDVVFGAWDVIRKVFNKTENKDMTLADRFKLFFYDYSFGPMFVQENYLTTEPECTGVKKSKSLEKLIRRHLTADCLSQSDVIEAKIRSINNWALLESQGFMCTVLPSYYMSGKMDQVRFPGWFGKNSQRSKCLRMVGELYSHARTSISGDKFSVRLDYAEPLLNRLLSPLIKKQAAGIDDTLEVMKTYSLLREDLTNLCDLSASFFNRNKNPFDSVSASVKSALTRKYNKTVVLNFAPPAASKKRKGAGGEAETFLEEDEFSEDEENEDNVDTDTLIKVKNKNNTQSGSSKSSGSQKESKSKGKSTKSSESKGSKGKGKK